VQRQNKWEQAGQQQRFFLLPLAADITHTPGSSPHVALPPQSLPPSLVWLVRRRFLHCTFPPRVSVCEMAFCLTLSCARRDMSTSDINCSYCTALNSHGRRWPGTPVAIGTLLQAGPLGTADNELCVCVCVCALDTHTCQICSATATYQS